MFRLNNTFRERVISLSSQASLIHHLNRSGSLLLRSPRRLSGDIVDRQPTPHAFQRFPLLAILACLLGCILVSNADASPKGAVVSISGSEQVDPKMEAQLTKTLRSIFKSKLDLVGQSETNTATQSVGCKGAACIRSASKLAEKTKARFIVAASVKNDYDIFTLVLSLKDTDYPEQATIQVSDKCEFCDTEALGDKLKELASDGSVDSALKKKAKSKGPTSFVLAVVTSPAGAEVIIDGKPRGLSPVNISKLTAKPHQVEIKLKGYQSQKKTVTPPTPLPTTPISETFTLKPITPKSFPIIIKTTPPKATVTLDGVKIKVKTPFKAKVKPGTHEVTFSLKGYEDHTLTFKTPAKAETIPLTVTLKKLQPVKPPVASQPKPSTKQSKPTVQPALTAAPPTEPPGVLSTALGGGLLGGGVVMTGIGAWLLTLHGEVACNDGRNRVTCPEIYDSKYPAGILLGVGAAAIGAGIISMIASSQWPDAPSVKGEVQSDTKQTAILPSIAPTPGGAAASFTLSF